MRLVWLAPLLAVGVAGCGAVGAIGIPLGGGAPATTAPANFNAPTTADVETDQLPPIGPMPVADPVADPPVLGPLAAPDEIGQPDQLAVLAADTAIDVSFDDLLGAWTLTIDSGVCQLFLSGTPWENGFRGSTRDCLSDALDRVSSWRLDNQEVVLAAAGVDVARLYPINLFRDGGLVTNARFEGQMIAGGTPVAFFR